MWISKMYEFCLKDYSTEIVCFSNEKSLCKSVEFKNIHCSVPKGTDSKKQTPEFGTEYKWRRVILKTLKLSLLLPDSDRWERKKEQEKRKERKKNKTIYSLKMDQVKERKQGKEDVYGKKKR